MSKILIIEDEEAIADLEKDYLELSVTRNYEQRYLDFIPRQMIMKRQMPCWI